MAVPVRRALLSVSDKTGLIDFARRLRAFGVELVATGGTASELAAAGLPLVDVSAVTQFPEILGGRVKTLHPHIHAGILARRDMPDHMDTLAKAGIAAIDLVVVNLYPFEQTVAAGRSPGKTIEMIDVGGPAMIRAAAKNAGDVAVVVDPSQYSEVFADMDASGGAISATLRRRLAAEAFARTAAYDAAIAAHLLRQAGVDAPRWRALGGTLVQSLRYGENPHQKAAFYATGAGKTGLAAARQMQGKELSFNNLNDADAALRCIAEFDGAETAACVIVKHANPCGVAQGETVAAAYRAALACDPVSAFGGIVAVNRPLTAEAAHEVTGLFTEVVVAPDADTEAKAVFAKKPNLRLLLAEPLTGNAEISFRTVAGGFLVQDRDDAMASQAEMTIVTQRRPSAAQVHDLLFALRVVKHVKSNAIVIARDGATLGIGAGQMSRVDATRIASARARALGSAGAAAASDAFFPFPDGLEELAAAGVVAVIQPGGSMRDAEVIAAADRLGLAMAFTGLRHFLH
jgi:phosphoribosylaminoimidazolecarboxamide formyltransferase/IMP cyclohydrolase